MRCAGVGGKRGKVDFAAFVFATTWGCCAMATVLSSLSSYSSYRDSRSPLSTEDQHANLALSSTVYVGNLSFFSSEEQIYQLFSRIGEIKRIIMGLDRNAKTPCGFCFVECVFSITLSHFASQLTHRLRTGTFIIIMPSPPSATSPAPNWTNESSAPTSIPAISTTVNTAAVNPAAKSETSTVRHTTTGEGNADGYPGCAGDDFDAGRGGWGQLKTRLEIEQERQEEQDDLYRTDGGKEVPSGAGRDEHDDEVRVPLRCGGAVRVLTVRVLLEPSIQSGTGRLRFPFFFILFASSGVRLCIVQHGAVRTS